MKPVTIELSPTEALTLLGIVQAYAKARRKRALPSSVTERIFAKVDKALLDATTGEPDITLGTFR